MNNISVRQLGPLGAVFAVGTASLMASGVLTAAPAQSEPSSVPKGVRVQCTGFYGPNAQWPHYLTGCARRNGTTGSGQTNRTAPGTETITWTAPFLNGKSMQLTNIANQPVNPPSGLCPGDHPAEVKVSGTIGADSKWAGSPVTATICANATDFTLKPGSFFVISNTPNDMDIDAFNDEP